MRIVDCILWLYKYRKYWYVWDESSCEISKKEAPIPETLIN